VAIPDITRAPKALKSKGFLSMGAPAQEYEDIPVKEKGRCVAGHAQVSGPKVDQEARLVPDKSRVITFDIRKSDIEMAMKSLSSTIDNFQYAALFTYAKRT
jgi:hypothetical protein